MKDWYRQIQVLQPSDPDLTDDLTILTADRFSRRSIQPVERWLGFGLGR